MGTILVTIVATAFGVIIYNKLKPKVGTFESKEEPIAAPIRSIGNLVYVYINNETGEIKTYEGGARPTSSNWTAIDCWYE